MTWKSTAGFGAHWNGKRLFRLTYTHEDCGRSHLIFLGDALELPPPQQLWERMVEAEDSHSCEPIDPMPVPPEDTDERTPY